MVDLQLVGKVMAGVSSFCLVLVLSLVTSGVMDTRWLVPEGALASVSAYDDVGFGPMWSGKKDGGKYEEPYTVYTTKECCSDSCKELKGIMAACLIVAFVAAVALATRLSVFCCRKPCCCGCCGPSFQHTSIAVFVMSLIAFLACCSAAGEWNNSDFVAFSEAEGNPATCNPLAFVVPGGNRQARSIGIGLVATAPGATADLSAPPRRRARDAADTNPLAAKARSDPTTVSTTLTVRSGHCVVAGGGKCVVTGGAGDNAFTFGTRESRVGDKCGDGEANPDPRCEPCVVEAAVGAYVSWSYPRNEGDFQPIPQTPFTINSMNSTALLELEAAAQTAAGTGVARHVKLTNSTLVFPGQAFVRQDWALCLDDMTSPVLLPGSACNVSDGGCVVSPGFPLGPEEETKCAVLLPPGSISFELEYTKDGSDDALVGPAVTCPDAGNPNFPCQSKADPFQEGLPTSNSDRGALRTFALNTSEIDSPHFLFESRGQRGSQRFDQRKFSAFRLCPAGAGRGEFSASRAAALARGELVVDVGDCATSADGQCVESASDQGPGRPAAARACQIRAAGNKTIYWTANSSFGDDTLLVDGNTRSFTDRDVTIAAISPARADDRLVRTILSNPATDTSWIGCFEAGIERKLTVLPGSAGCTESVGVGGAQCVQTVGFPGHATTAFNGDVSCTLSLPPKAKVSFEVAMSPLDSLSLPNGNPDIKTRGGPNVYYNVTLDTTGLSFQTKPRPFGVTENSSFRLCLSDQPPPAGGFAVEAAQPPARTPASQGGGGAPADDPTAFRSQSVVNGVVTVTEVKNGIRTVTQNGKIISQGPDNGQSIDASTNLGGGGGPSPPPGFPPPPPPPTPPRSGSYGLTLLGGENGDGCDSPFRPQIVLLLACFENGGTGYQKVAAGLAFGLFALLLEIGLFLVGYKISHSLSGLGAGENTGANPYRADAGTVATNPSMELQPTPGADGAAAADGSAAPAKSTV